jgi:hypothetical protein
MRFGASMGALRYFCIFLIATWLGCGTALAEKRIALTMGNSAYRNVPRLTNPANDAVLVGEMFKKAGFDSVDVRLDLNVSDMRKTLRDFGARARDADVAVIYYAGHGIELDGNNYLIPTDATLETDSDVLDEAIAVDRALFAVEPAKQLRLIILDACRDNPFAKTMRRTIASRAIGRGLAKVEPSSPNTMIAFAAKAGSTASDGDSKNSPFATALVDYLPKPGLDLRKAFGFVRDDVLKKTGYKQEPYVYGSLGGDDVPLVPAKPVAAAAPQGPQASPQDLMRRDYELALQLGTRDGWNAFLAQYPDGFYANLAKGQLNKIAAEETRVAAAEKARLAEEEKGRLAAEGARKTELAKAAAQAKAAEGTRIAAEKVKQIEQAKAEAADQQRKTAEAAAAKALADKQAAEKAVAELTAKQAADKQAPTNADQKVAVLSPPSQPASSPAELAKSVQLELRRVGCLTAAADGDWNSASEHSLSQFDKHAGMKFDVKLANTDALDAIKAKPGRVCPLVCDHGSKADGDSCVKIVCKEGYQLSGDNTCERSARSAKRNDAPTAPTTPNNAGSRTRELGATAASKRADHAYFTGTYEKCMGPVTGCYQRAIKTMTPDQARTWCTRAPTC